MTSRQGKDFTQLNYPPPSLYNESLVAALQNIFARQGYELLSCELNFALNLKTLRLENYEKDLPANGRKNLVGALNENLRLTKCDTLPSKELAYKIIAQNRAAKGYPLRMTWEQVKETIKIVPHDFFVVFKDDTPVASAIVFHVTEKIVQVIYWGNIPDKSSAKSMNYLAYKLTAHYHERGMKYLDIGPSTENGVPNYGLCDFKQHIGCDIGSKLVMQKIF